MNSVTSLLGHGLIAAVKAGDLAGIQQALAQGAPVDFYEKAFADANLITVPGRTALMWAIVENQTAAAQMLLAAGASAAAKQQVPLSEGCTAWELAGQFGRTEILALFLKHAPDSKLQVLALCAAARAGHVDAAALLLDAGVPVDVRDPEKKTPLMAAAVKGQAAVVDSLLKRGAQVDLRDTGRYAGTALNKAVTAVDLAKSVTVYHGLNLVAEPKGEPLECVRMLLAAGADPNAMEQDGEYLIVKAGGHPSALRMLLAAGANPNLVVAHSGKTSLHWSAMSGDVESVRLLLDSGAEPSPVDEHGKTPLDFANERSFPEVAQMLERAGGVTGMETEEGRAAVDEQYAAQLGEERRIATAEADYEAMCAEMAKRAQNDTYVQAVKLLESVTQTACEAVNALPALACCKAGENRARGLIDAERERFAALGCTIVICGQDYFNQDDHLAVIPTTDPLEVVAAMGTAGPNYSVFTSDVVAVLDQLQKIVSFQVVKATHDTLVMELSQKIPKRHVRTVAVRLYEICPDLIDQGFESMTKLRQHLEQARELTLWWD